MFAKQFHEFDSERLYILLVILSIHEILLSSFSLVISVLLNVKVSVHLKFPQCYKGACPVPCLRCVSDSLRMNTSIQGNSARPAYGRVTRQSIAMLKQCASSTSPVKCPLQNPSTPNHLSTGARRVLLEANDKPCPESPGLQAFQRHISDFPHKHEVI